jgi:prolyl oligopeptidase PreP (S9A serine peptidase family)
VAALQEQLEECRLNKDNCERCTCFDESEFRTSKFTEHPDGALSRATLRSFAQHPPEDEILIDSSKLSRQPYQDSLQVSEE